MIDSIALLACLLIAGMNPSTVSFANDGEITAPCGVPWCRRSNLPIGMLDGGSQPSTDRQEHPWQSGVSFGGFEHQVMWHGVEEGPDFEVAHLSKLTVHFRSPSRPADGT